MRRAPCRRCGKGTEASMHSAVLLWRFGEQSCNSQADLFLAPESRQSVRCLLLFLASIGPRLSNDRLDRPRMFRYMLDICSVALQDTSPLHKPVPEGFYKLPFESINELFECIVREKFKRVSLPAIFATLKPSAELDDDTLLSFAEHVGHEDRMDTLIVKYPKPTFGEGVSGYDTVRMTLSAFCSRFREKNRSKWVGLFHATWDDAPPDLQLNHARGVGSFLNLAAWDAMGRKPTRHVYTTTSANAETIHGLVPQTIASAGILPAVLGLGGSRIFRIFYPGFAEWSGHGSHCGCGRSKTQKPYTRRGKVYTRADRLPK